MSTEAIAAVEGQQPASQPAVQQPAAPEPAKGQEPAAPEIKYEVTGDPGMDYAHNFLARAGIAPDHPAYVAAKGGDFSLLEAELGAKNIPGWKEALALGKQSYEKAAKEVEENQKAVGDAVLAIAEQAGVDWEEVVKFAQANATDDERNVLNGLMESPFGAKIAASYLTGKFVEASGVEKAPASPVADVPAIAQPSAGGGKLSRVEFAAESEKLYRKLGNDYTSSPEYAALVRRRA